MIRISCIILGIVFSLNGMINGNNVMKRLTGKDVAMPSYQQRSIQKLLDSAHLYALANRYDEALMYYDSIIHTSTDETDTEHVRQVIEALHQSAIIYSRRSNYRDAYEFLINALVLSEKFYIDDCKSSILRSVGNIYLYFGEWKTAEHYYGQALNEMKGNTDRAIILNNLGSIQLGLGNWDSAIFVLNQALHVRQETDTVSLYNILYNTAFYYDAIRVYDSAFHYFYLSLDEVRKANRVEKEAHFLGQMGKSYFEIGKIDSALSYVRQSMRIAEEYGFKKILSGNYLILSKIEKGKGNNRLALDYLENHVRLKDSSTNPFIIGEVSRLQYSFEASKMSQVVNELIEKQEIKDNKIRSQKWRFFIIFLILLSVVGVLVVILSQKRMLQNSYKTLVQKNVEIMKLLQMKPPEDDTKKSQKFELAPDAQQEILDKILVIMEDTKVICDTEFSIDKLADLIGSNQNYVSQAINHLLKKNFRAFLNEYRIKEAQRLFADLDMTKNTIENVGSMVGFKSRDAFRTSFKEVTGVTPKFYLKSI